MERQTCGAVTTVIGLSVTFTAVLLDPAFAETAHADGLGPVQAVEGLLTLTQVSVGPCGPNLQGSGETASNMRMAGRLREWMQPDRQWCSANAVL